MKRETFNNPDALIGLRPWQNPGPVFSHAEVVHHPPLQKSGNPVISRLLESGYEVHETVSTFYMGFPTREFTLDRHFVCQERNEFQIRLGTDDGFIQIRFESPERVYLTLFYIAYEKQGKGLARRHFKAITDALFRAGAVFLLGFVSPSIYPARKAMDRTRLLRFYVEEAGFFASGEGWIGKFSPYADNSIKADALCVERPENVGI